NFLYLDLTTRRTRSQCKQTECAVVEKIAKLQLNQVDNGVDHAPIVYIVITALTVLDQGFARLQFGYDSEGNICGSVNRPRTKNQNKNLNLTDKKYVLFFDYLKPKTSKKVCVQSCPTKTLHSEAEYKEYSRQTNTSLCFYSLGPGEYSKDSCPSFPVYKSDMLLNRCVPQISEILGNNTMTLLKNNSFLNLQELKFSSLELYRKLPDIGYLSLAALLFTIILVVLLRYIAKLMVVLVLILSSLGSIGLSALLWLKYSDLRQNNDQTIHSMPILEIEMQSKTAYLIYSIAMTIFTVILLLIIIAMRKRIGLVLRLFGEAQKAITDMPLLLGMPIITFVFLLLFLFYWITTAIMIYSFGEYEESDIELYGQRWAKKSFSRFIWWYHVVGLVWVSEFIFGCQSMVIAGSVSKWYFTRPKSALRAPICTAISRLFLYHLGSIALGSFLIVLVRIPRYILMYLQDKIKASKSTIAAFCSKGCICCLWCLEKFIKFINYNAYTVIAIEGKSFCASAQKAFVIVVENSLRIATINTVGDFMLFLSKLTVTALTLFLGIYWFKIPIDDPLKNIHQIKIFLLPLAVVCVISFLIAHCFFTVYEMVIDAIMVCFCEDCRANDGSAERPYYMSSSLKKFVDESSSTQIIGD
ncbi:choline transporter 1 isoform X2, partial [Brachionus plicatilis]